MKPTNQQSDDSATKHRRGSDMRFRGEPCVLTVATPTDMSRNSGLRAEADESGEVWVSERDTPSATLTASVAADEPIEVWMSEQIDAEGLSMNLPLPSVSASPVIVATAVPVTLNHRRTALAFVFAFGVATAAATLGVVGIVGPVTPMPPTPGVRSAPETISFPSSPPDAPAGVAENAAKPEPASSSLGATVPTAGPIEGRLRLTTTPSDARITVDGIGWGQTPLTVEHLPIGKRTVRVTLAGYTSQQFSVDLRGDRPEVTLHVTLAQETNP